MDLHLRERLHEILEAHGRVKSLQLLESSEERGRLILVTMESTSSAMSAQVALGLQAFGFDALLVNERWLQRHLGAPDAAAGGITGTAPSPS